uniref:Uncharacterized protein TCIL3000_10_220 n=1 Tax=Trypanosoma congolense (strain IL3000) TaxID=1068625 RepID=G0UV49_TRYCI|nr:unnamed protein product [Trypanosoma congolense IL3000]
MFGQEPPPPRYVLNADTGKWKKRVVAAERRVRPPAAATQSTLDISLYYTMHTSKTQMEEEGRKIRVPPDVAGQIAVFEGRHNSVVSRSFSTSRWATQLVSPVVGLLCGIPLYDVYAALVKQKGVEWEKYREEPDSPACLMLSMDELYDVCKGLVHYMVDYAYLRDMFMMLPFSDENESVKLSCFFSYLVESSFHPTLNRNVEALFRAFDPDETDVISEATLTGAVLGAFAELNLFGNLRGEWERMATSLEMAGCLDLRIVDNARLLSREAVRALFCTTQHLYMAMEAIDLDGSKVKSSS